VLNAWQQTQLILAGDQQADVRSFLGSAHEAIRSPVTRPSFDWRSEGLARPVFRERFKKLMEYGEN
jgi:hypothetical protein